MRESRPAFVLAQVWEPGANGDRFCPEAVVGRGVVSTDVMTASHREQPRRCCRTDCSFWAIASAPSMTARRLHRGVGSILSQFNGDVAALG